MFLTAPQNILLIILTASSFTDLSQGQEQNEPTLDSDLSLALCVVAGSFPVLLAVLLAAYIISRRCKQDRGKAVDKVNGYTITSDQSTHQQPNPSNQRHNHLTVHDRPKEAGRQNYPIAVQEGPLDKDSGYIDMSGGRGTSDLSPQNRPDRPPNPLKKGSKFVVQSHSESTTTAPSTEQYPKQHVHVIQVGRRLERIHSCDEVAVQEKPAGKDNGDVGDNRRGVLPDLLSQSESEKTPIPVEAGVVSGNPMDQSNAAAGSATIAPSTNQQLMARNHKYDKVIIYKRPPEMGLPHSQKDAQKETVGDNKILHVDGDYVYPDLSVQKIPAKTQRSRTIEIVRIEPAGRRNAQSATDAPSTSQTPKSRDQRNCHVIVCKKPKEISRPYDQVAFQEGAENIYLDVVDDYDYPEFPVLTTPDKHPTPLKVDIAETKPVQERNIEGCATAGSTNQRLKSRDHRPNHEMVCERRPKISQPCDQTVAQQEPAGYNRQNHVVRGEPVVQRNRYSAATSPNTTQHSASHDERLTRVVVGDSCPNISDSYDHVEVQEEPAEEKNLYLDVGSHWPVEDEPVSPPRRVKAAKSELAEQNSETATAAPNTNQQLKSDVHRYNHVILYERPPGSSRSSDQTAVQEEVIRKDKGTRDVDDDGVDTDLSVQEEPVGPPRRVKVVKATPIDHKDAGGVSTDPSTQKQPTPVQKKPKGHTRQIPDDMNGHVHPDVPVHTRQDKPARRFTIISHKKGSTHDDVIRSFV